MAILEILGGKVIESLTKNLFAGATDVFKSYINKEISETEAMGKLQQVLVQSFQQIEVTHAQELTKSYTAFISAAKDNKTMARAWAVTLYSQLFVLFWHQFVVPFVAWVGMAPGRWSSGSTVEWSYALIAGLLGLGVMGLRTGPAKLDMETFKKLVTLKR